MAAFPKPPQLGSPSPATVLPCGAHKISGLIVGENIALGDACYINVTDGKVYRSNGSAANAAAKVRGFAATGGLLGQNDAITLIHAVVWGWDNSAGSGTDLYVSGTVPGGLDTVASTGGVAPVGYVIDANRVFLGRSGY